MGTSDNTLEPRALDTKERDGLEQLALASWRSIRHVCDEVIVTPDLLMQYVFEGKVVSVIAVLSRVPTDAANTYDLLAKTYGYRADNIRNSGSREAQQEYRELTQISQGFMYLAEDAGIQYQY